MIVNIFIVFVIISNQFPRSIQDNSLQINKKAAFATNGIIHTMINWKISINLLINSQKNFTEYIAPKSHIKH